MKCPKCYSKETRVTCTEHHNKNSQTFTKRYCRCLKCRTRFRTIEKKFKIKYPEYLPKYKNALYNVNQTDFLYKAKSILE